MGSIEEVREKVIDDLIYDQRKIKVSSFKATTQYRLRQNYYKKHRKLVDNLVKIYK
jgi:hypothetical protein